ncbi:DUF1206 domain-containing protein [Modestobacter sp. SYSU DS0875]
MGTTSGPGTSARQARNSDALEHLARVGQFGHPAKGTALALVGGLLGWAALTFDAEKASGLDGALQTLLDAPFGRLLLPVVAVGIAAFGVFSFFRARFPQRT